MSTRLVDPPSFQESSRCDVCKCSFNTFRRRHHCRSCGRTLCHEHSANQMALPQYGIYANVRVCADCFNHSSRENETQNTSILVDSTSDDMSRLNIGFNIESKPGSDGENLMQISAECKCGMPLCICKAVQATDPEVKKADTQPNVRHSKSSIYRSAEPNSKNVVAIATSSKQSMFFGRGLATSVTMDQDHTEYEATGEGLREAIKNGDVNAVQKLLSKGVDPNYSDKQRLSLLHLAALFNQTEIVFILMDHGASLESRNAQGETPLDCAPTMLQYKMRQKMERSW